MFQVKCPSSVCVLAVSHLKLQNCQKKSVEPQRSYVKNNDNNNNHLSTVLVFLFH